MIEKDVSRLVKVVEGNGQPGLLTTVTEFISEWRGREVSREDMYKNIDRKWNLRMVILGILLAALDVAMRLRGH